MKKLYLLGHPVSHSLSPLMQNAAIRHFGLDWRYEALDVPPEDLVAKLKELEEDEDVVGCNVTVPHKVAVYEWLERRYKSIDAVRARAVNTLVRRSDGAFGGESTDFFGAFDALRAEGFGKDRFTDFQLLQSHDVAILGTGGSAQTIALGFASHDSRPRSITIFGRNLARAADLAKQARESSGSIPITGAHLSDFPEWSRAGRTSIVIQTTTVGMDSGEAPGQSPVPTGSIGRGQIAFDLVYKPHDTPFLLDAKANGATIVHGINMLVGQGAWSLQRWVQASGDIDDNAGAIMEVMRSALGV